MYKMYNDIKEERQDEERLINHFSLGDNFTGVKTLEDSYYKTSGFFVGGNPNGLIIVHDKVDDSKLYARFENGKPNGVWCKYDKYGNEIDKKEYKY